MNAQAGIRERDAIRAWPPSVEEHPHAPVEEVRLGDGLLLVLSRFAGGTEAAFEHEEEADVVGIGFHLKGGAAFDMGGTRFSTRVNDIWAGASPRSARSDFCLPASGFDTVSLRMAPHLARSGALAGCRLPPELVRMGANASSRISAVHIGRITPAAALILRSMLSMSAAEIGTSLFHESCLHALLTLLDTRQITDPFASPHRLSEAKLDRARQLLEQQYANPPTITALARAVGTNEFTLKRAFKEAFGTTIYGYVRRYRMEQAAARLDQGASVQDAAAAVGYECPRAFADAFRRNYGILPSAMTRAARASAPARHG